MNAEKMPLHLLTLPSALTIESDFPNWLSIHYFYSELLVFLVFCLCSINHYDISSTSKQTSQIWVSLVMCKLFDGTRLFNISIIVGAHSDPFPS